MCELVLTTFMCFSVVLWSYLCMFSPVSICSARMCFPERIYSSTWIYFHVWLCSPLYICSPICVCAHTLLREYTLTLVSNHEVSCGHLLPKGIILTAETTYGLETVYLEIHSYSSTNVNSLGRWNGLPSLCLPCLASGDQRPRARSPTNRSLVNQTDLVNFPNLVWITAGLITYSLASGILFISARLY